MAYLFPQAWERRRRRLRVVGVAVTLLAITITALTLAPTGGPSRGPATTGNVSRTPRSFVPPTDEPAGWSVSYPIALPRNFPAIGGIATDPASGTVWFLSARIPKRTHPLMALFSWSTQTHQLAEFPLPASDSAFDGPAVPMAATPNGNVWVGLRNQLVVFDSATGLFSNVPLPAVHHGIWGTTKPDLFDTSDPIVGLAASSSGTVVVARQFAHVLQLVDSRTSAVRTLSLPGRTALNNADYSFLGNVAVDASGSDVAAVLIARRTDKPANVRELWQYVNGRWEFTATKSQPGLVEFSGEELVASNFNGSVGYGTFHVGQGAVQLTSLPLSSTRNGFDGVALANATVLLRTDDAVQGVSRHGSARLLTLGEIPWIAGGGGPHPGICPQRSTPIPCEQYYGPILPEFMIWGGGNSVWFLPENFGKIGLIAQR